MGFAAYQQEIYSRSTWRSSMLCEKTSETAAISSATSNTSLSSSSYSMDSDYSSSISNNFVWSDPHLRLTYCFFSHPSNTRCADCRKKLFVDGESQIFVAYYDKASNLNPIDVKEPNTNESDHTHKPSSVPFAVFICVDCARAHRTISPNVSKIKAFTNSFEAWTKYEISFVEKHAGNHRANAILERFMPKNFIIDGVSNVVTLQGREIFIRAKYEALAFLFPGTLRDTEAIEASWVRKSKKNKYLQKKPSRLIDYFCVIGSTGQLEKKKGEILKNGPLKFETDILDCYPGKSFYPEISFPQHVSKFVFPEGCVPYLKSAKPGFFTFVLTLGTGDRLYGAALQIYEENSKNEFIHSYEYLQLVTFYLPKCLTILSHYPLFDTFHSLLLQLYHISQSPNNPLPLERYIAFLSREIPLPPSGKVEVIAKFLPQLPPIKIRRPSKNELPLIGVSLQPLFSCLSIGNVMVVFACLLTETRVVLCSKYYTLLTPICECLLGLLFPFEWQGCYIPVLPYNMLDVLDAPFPYLVGVHSRYLRENKYRTQGPVFVDLDDDIVHLGFDIDGASGINQVCGRRTPSLPEKDAEKLKRVLVEYAESMYLVPTCQQKGRITYGEYEHMNNSDRESYSIQTGVSDSSCGRNRDVILAKVQLAYNQHVVSVHNFGMKSDQSVMKKGNLTWLKSLKNDENLKELRPYDGINLYDRADDETESFSGEQIRLGFLRFFVSILLNHNSYIDKYNSTFNTRAFLSQLNISDSNQIEFVSSMLSTQMFAKFIEESTIEKSKPEIIFFNESIIAKKNRSRTRTALNGTKLTPFLSDDSDAINKRFYPPSPSVDGLSIKSNSYYYEKFPKINPKRIGKINEPKGWDSDEDSLSIMPPAQQSASSIVWGSESLSASDFSKEYVLTGVRDIEWAFYTLAHKCFTEEKPYFTDVLSSAQKKISSVRERQLSILQGIRMFQNRIHTRIDRQRYLRFRAAIIQIQRRHRATCSGSSYTFVYSSQVVLKHKYRCQSMAAENFEVVFES